MKLLIFTQKVDLNDDLLGFMHRWIKEFAIHCEKLTVICLEAGKYDLPENVSVLSLGKEKVRARIRYIINFYKNTWKLRREYDYVFVHMNCEYVLLGGFLWLILGKKIILWYAHYLVDWRVRLAVIFSNRVVTSTSFACNIKSKKLLVVGQGIDTNYFQNLNFARSSEKTNILFLGRISPVKDLATLLQAVSLVSGRGKDVFLNIVGAPTPSDENYFESIKYLTKKLDLTEMVKFCGCSSNDEAMSFYNKNDIFINLTRTGSFDKTTLEAMACERPVIVCNNAFKNIFPDDLTDKLIFQEKNSSDLADKLINLINLGRHEREIIGSRLREIIVKDHSLKRLVAKLIGIFKDEK